MSRSIVLSELRAILQLALPIVGSQLLFMSMGTVDTIFAGRHSATVLAAVAVGANAFFLGFVLFVGLFLALAAQLARAQGAGEGDDALGQRIAGGLGLAVVLGLCWAGLILLTTPPLLALLDLTAVVTEAASQYLHIMALACLPLCACFALRNGAEGLGETRVPLQAGLVGLALNAMGNYALIYGHWGFPELGAAGAAWAGILSALGMLSTYLWAYSRHVRLRRLNLLQHFPGAFRHGWRPLLRLGLPIAVIVTAESWLFQIGALAMARFGELSVSAHQIAVNFASMAFMVPLAIGMATTVRVGDAMGRGDARAAARASGAGLTLSIGFALLSSSLMWGLPTVIAAAYTHVEDVAALAARFLLYAAIFQLFDGIQATSNGALRGFHDARLPMFITVGTYWGVAIPCAILLAFKTPLGPVGIWWGFIIGLVMAAVGLSLRLRRQIRKALSTAGTTAR